MNKRSLTGIFILVWLCCSFSISYACNLPPEAYISGCPKYTAIDHQIGFDGLYSTDHDGYIVDWRWTFPPQAYDFIYNAPWEVFCKFNATGIYTVNLEVEDDKGATDDFNCTVYVIKVDLDIIGMSESEEDDPGRYIAVNTDDDDTNSLQDRYEYGTVDNENDLVEISLSITPSMDHGFIKLTASLLLSVWEELTKGNPAAVPPTSQAIWDLSEGPFPETLWVEGYNVHNNWPFGGLRFFYLHPTMGHTVDLDGVRFNPVEVKLIMDGVNEDNEEFPGNFIGFNDDDDDGDGLLDFIDYDNPDEDDLVRIIPHWVEPSWYTSGTVTFDVTQVGPQVRVWGSATKGTEISLPETYNTPADLPKQFWVEGFEASNGPRDVEFTLTYTKEGLTFEDKIKVTVVEVDLHATDLDGSTVSNQYEENPGIGLHFNLDNDNDSDNSVPSTKLPGADYYEATNPVTNEDDVKSLEMSLRPSLDFGSVSLSVPSSAWLWESPTKGSSNFFLTDGIKTWDLSDEDERNDFLGHCSTLYVEGMNTGSGDIVLKYEYPLGNEIHSDKVCYDFKAAYCGDQPKTEGVHYPGATHSQRKDFEDTFDKLKRCEWSITDQTVTNVYNCIAFSVFEYNVWYNEWDIDRYFGDPPNGNGIFEDSDMDAFYFQKMGWSLITSGTDEQKAFQASAMYYSYDADYDYPGSPPGPGYHAARNKQCLCGAWIMYESKVGEWETIEHVWDQLNGGVYGEKPDRFYKLFIDP